MKFSKILILKYSRNVRYSLRSKQIYIEGLYVAFISDKFLSGEDLGISIQSTVNRTVQCRQKTKNFLRRSYVNFNFTVTETKITQLYVNKMQKYLLIENVVYSQIFWTKPLNLHILRLVVVISLHVDLHCRDVSEDAHTMCIVPYSIILYYFCHFLSYFGVLF